MIRVPLTQDAVTERLRQLGNLQQLTPYPWEIEPLVGSLLLFIVRKRLEKGESLDIQAEAMSKIMKETHGHMNPVIVKELIEEFTPWAIEVIRNERRNG